MNVTQTRAEQDKMALGTGRRGRTMSAMTVLYVSLLAHLKPIYRRVGVLNPLTGLARRRQDGHAPRRLVVRGGALLGDAGSRDGAHLLLA